jgi:predicted alpha/beta hydrolase family esterase
MNKNMENKLNCIVIHGCPSEKEKAMNPETRTYDKHWIPWIKRELVKRGIKTETPLMPNPWEPVYEDFKKEFEKYSVNENTILIGHSCGTTFLVRWLGESKKKIDKLILVAPWIIPGEGKDDPFRKVFYTFEVDRTIKDRVNEVIIFTSDNEKEDGKKSAKIFEETLNGKVIELKGMGHYCLGRTMSTEEFPELLEEVIK